MFESELILFLKLVWSKSENSFGWKEYWCQVKKASWPPISASTHVLANSSRQSKKLSLMPGLLRTSPSIPYRFRKYALNWIISLEVWVVVVVMVLTSLYRLSSSFLVNRIYPPELQLNKANTSDTEAPFLDLHLSISNGFVSSKIYDKRDDFDFDIVNFPFLDGDVPRSTSYGIYISQLIRFARVSSHVVDFNARNKSLTAKLLQQGYRYHKLRKTFSKFYRRHYELVSKFSVWLKTLLHQGLSEPEFYGDLLYKFKIIVGSVGLIFLISSEKLSFVTNVLDIT